MSTLYPTGQRTYTGMLRTKKITNVQKFGGIVIRTVILGILSDQKNTCATSGDDRIWISLPSLRLISMVLCYCCETNYNKLHFSDEKYCLHCSYQIYPFFELWIAQSFISGLIGAESNIHSQGMTYSILMYSKRERCVNNKSTNISPELKDMSINTAKWRPPMDVCSSQPVTQQPRCFHNATFVTIQSMGARNVLRRT